MTASNTRDHAMNKKLISTQIITSLGLLLLSVSTQATTITVGTIENIIIADKFIDASSSPDCESVQNAANCDFLKTNPTTTYLNDAGIAEVVTSNPASYVLSPNVTEDPNRNSAYIDLGFNDGNVVTGDGNDLVIFIVGHTTSFGINAFDEDNNSLFNGLLTYNVPTPVFDDINEVFTERGDTVFNPDGTWSCIAGAVDTCADGTGLSAAFFDFGDTVANNTEIARIRILLGEDYNGSDGTRPRFSLAGGFHTQATVVPLPLSVVLFSSGLALLGWFGRRKPV